MSGWDGYVNDMMKNTGLFDNASIFAKDGLNEWAATEDFSVSKTEAAALLEECQGFRGIFPPSVVVHGSDYQPILIEPTRIYAEKKSNPNAGLVVLIGKQCVVLGTYPPNVQPGLAVDAIEKLVIYLAEQGF